MYRTVPAFLLVTASGHRVFSKLPSNLVAVLARSNFIVARGLIWDYLDNLVFIDTNTVELSYIESIVAINGNFEFWEYVVRDMNLPNTDRLYIFAAAKIATNNFNWSINI